MKIAMPPDSVTAENDARNASICEFVRGAMLLGDVLPPNTQLAAQLPGSAHTSPLPENFLLSPPKLPPRKIWRNLAFRMVPAGLLHDRFRRVAGPFTRLILHPKKDARCPVPALFGGWPRLRFPRHQQDEDGRAGIAALT